MDRIKLNWTDWTNQTNSYLSVQFSPQGNRSALNQENDEPKFSVRDCTPDQTEQITSLVWGDGLGFRTPAPPSMGRYPLPDARCELAPTTVHPTPPRPPPTHNKQIIGKYQKNSKQPKKEKKNPQQKYKFTKIKKKKIHNNIYDFKLYKEPRSLAAICGRGSLCKPMAICECGSNFYDHWCFKKEEKKK